MQLTIYEYWKRGIKMIEKKYVEKSYGTAEISYQGAIISGVQQGASSINPDGCHADESVFRHDGCCSFQRNETDS